MCSFHKCLLFAITENQVTKSCTQYLVDFRVQRITREDLFSPSLLLMLLLRMNFIQGSIIYLIFHLILITWHTCWLIQEGQADGGRMNEWTNERTHQVYWTNSQYCNSFFKNLVEFHTHIFISELAHVTQTYLLVLYKSVGCA